MYFDGVATYFGVFKCNSYCLGNLNCNLPRLSARTKRRVRLHILFAVSYGNECVLFDCVNEKLVYWQFFSLIVVYAIWRTVSALRRLHRKKLLQNT